MSLDPSPLSSRPTPLLNPTDPVPGRGSALIGGIVAVALAVVVMVVMIVVVAAGAAQPAEEQGSPHPDDAQSGNGPEDWEQRLRQHVLREE